MKRKLPLAVVTLFTFIALSVAISTMTYATYNEVSGKYDGSTLKMQLVNPGGSYGHYGIRVVDASGQIIHDGNMQAFNSPYGGTLMWTAYNVNLDTTQLNTYVIEVYVLQQEAAIAKGNIQFVDTPLDDDSDSGISMLLYSDGSVTSLTISGKGDLSVIFSEHYATQAHTIQQVIIKSGISSIGDKAFAYCTGLSTIDIPSSVKIIGVGAFEGCGQLTVNYAGSEEEWNAITIKGNNEPLKSATMNYAKKTAGACGANGNNLTWAFQDGTLTISGSGAMADFEGGYDAIPWYYLRDKIEQIKLPGGLTKISSYAFCDCTYVTSIKVPEGVTEIGSYAFKIDCIKRVDIPDSLTKIGTDAFLGCPIEEVHYAGTINRWQMMNIADGNSSLINAPRIYDVTAGHSIIKFEANGGSGEIKEIVFDPNVTLELPKNTFTAPSGKSFKEWMVGDKRYKPGEQCQFTDNATVKAIWCTVLHDISFHYISCVNGFQEWTGAYDSAGLAFNGLMYDDSWFSPSSKTYNHKLATLSMAMALAGHEGGNADGTRLAQNQDWTIKEFYEKLHFDVDTSYHQMGYGADDNDSIAFTFCAKQIDVGEAEPVTLLAVTLRGGGYGGGGWAGNADVGIDNLYHVGFKKAAQYIEKHLLKYLDVRTDFNPKTMRIWITGFSRSAATANLLSASLSKVYPVDHIFTYTFATPSNELIENFDSTPNNIFNIINPLDLVPMVAPKTWGFGKRGTTLQLFDDIESNLKTTLFVETFQELAGKDSSGSSIAYQTPDSHITTYLLEWLLDCFENRAAYAYNLQTPLVQWMKGDSHAFDSVLYVTSVDELIELFSMQRTGTYLDYVAAAELISAERYERFKLFGSSDPYVKLLNKLEWAAIKGAREIDKIFHDQVAAIDDLPAIEENVQTILFIVDILKHGFSSKLFMQHWPEVYLAWMLSRELTETDVTNEYKLATVASPLTTSSSAVATFSSPVNVDVFDKSGNLVGRVNTETFSLKNAKGENKSYTVSSIDKSVTKIEAAVLGDNKFFILPDDQEYRIDIKANDQCQDGDSMNYSITSYNQGAESSTVSYNSIPLAKGSSFSGNITPSAQSITNCTLSSGDQQLKPSEVVHYDFLLGDLDNDHVITTIDIGLLCNIVVSKRQWTDFELKAGDIDGNQKLDSIDVSLLINQYIMSKSKTTKVG